MRFRALLRRHNHRPGSDDRPSSADLGHTSYPGGLAPDPRSFPSLAARDPEPLSLCAVPIDYLIAKRYEYNKALFLSATGDPDKRDKPLEAYCARAIRVIDRELDARDE